MENIPEQQPLPDDPELAFQQRFQDVSRVTARVFTKIIGLRDNSEKTWADVGTLGHIMEVMDELDQFLGNE